MTITTINGGGVQTNPLGMHAQPFVERVMLRTCGLGAKKLNDLFYNLSLERI